MEVPGVLYFVANEIDFVGCSLGWGWSNIIVLEEIPTAVRIKLDVQCNRTTEREIAATAKATNRVPVAVLERYKEEQDCRVNEFILSKSI